MPKRSIFAGFIAFSLICVSPGAAQPAPEAAMPAAKELVTILHLTDRFKVIFPAILRQLRSGITKGRPEVERDFDNIAPILISAMNVRVDELADQMAAIYARNFTADELREAVAFYRTPLGQKFLEKTPILAQEGMKMGQAFGAKVGDELEDRMIEELRKKGHDN